MRSYSNDVRMLRSRMNGLSGSRSSYPVPAMRHGDGDAGPGAGSGVAARPVLGLSSMRPSFLVDIPAAGAAHCRYASEGSILTRPRPTEAAVRKARTCPSVVADRPGADRDLWRGSAMPSTAGDDYDEDEDEDDDEREEGNEDDEEDDEDEEEEETWQVACL
jgi:hypothetical protein